MVEVLQPSLRELKTIPYSRRIEELLRLVSLEDALIAENQNFQNI
jgi:hypothetical protein